MDSFEELIKIDPEDLESLPRFRDNTAVVSSSDNALLVHTNIYDLKNLIVETERDSAAANPQLDLSLFVYDVSKIIHKLTSSQIKTIK